MTSKKTIEVTYLTNEHGIVCPLPLDFWPESAMYASIDLEGEILFGETLPTYKKGIYWHGEDCYSLGFTEIPEDPSKTFWIRPKENGCNI